MIGGIQLLVIHVIIVLIDGPFAWVEFFSVGSVLFTPFFILFDFLPIFLKKTLYYMYVLNFFYN